MDETSVDTFVVDVSGLVPLIPNDTVADDAAGFANDDAVSLQLLFFGGADESLSLLLLASFDASAANPNRKLVLSDFPNDEIFETSVFAPAAASLL